MLTSTLERAVEVIESIRLIEEEIPYVKTIPSIRNIYFGFIPAVCQVVHPVFLCYSKNTGFDPGIGDARKLEPFTSIP